MDPTFEYSSHLSEELSEGCALFHPQDHELSAGVTERNSTGSVIREIRLHSDIGPSCFKFMNT